MSNRKISSAQKIISEFRELTDGERQTMLEVLTAQYGQAKTRKVSEKRLPRKTAEAAAKAGIAMSSRTNAVETGGRD